VNSSHESYEASLGTEQMTREITTALLCGVHDGFSCQTSTLLEKPIGSDMVTSIVSIYIVLTLRACGEGKDGRYG